jgi:hypothetical protein
LNLFPAVCITVGAALAATTGIAGQMVGAKAPPTAL